MANEMKQAKDLGWDYISLSGKGFKGAVQSYQSTTGTKVALAFNYHEAFVIEDDQGLFGVEDIKQGIIQNKEIDIEATGQIEGVSSVAWETEEGSGEVEFDEEKLTQLGINDAEVKDSITKRIIALSALDKLVDMPLG